MASLEERIDALTEAQLRHGLEVFRSKLRAAEAAYLNACVHCGLCADSCHYYRTEPALDNVPARKLDHVAAAFKRRPAGPVPGRRARPFDRAMVRAC